MLHGVGKNWATDLAPQLKNGTFIVLDKVGFVEKYDVPATYEAVAAVIDPLLEPEPTLDVPGLLDKMLDAPEHLAGDSLADEVADPEAARDGVED
jgi:hypothetical protein